MSQTFISKAKTDESFQNQINILNNKVDSVAKNLTYFDFYNITSVVTEKQNFSTQVTNLMPNSSLVINCEPFFINDEHYNTGDIVFKTSNSTIAHIKAQTGGIYYPTKISKNSNDNSFSLTYKYSSSRPNTNTSDAVDINNDNRPANMASTITFTGLKTETESSIYGLWGPYVSLQSFNAFIKDGTLIQPYIKFYFYDGKSQEEVSVDYIIELDETNPEDKKWKVSFPDNQIKTANIWMKVK